VSGDQYWNGKSHVQLGLAFSVCVFRRGYAGRELSYPGQGCIAARDPEFGRADGNKDAIKSHIVKRARVIGGEIVVPRSGTPSHGVIQASLAAAADRCVTAAPSSAHRCRVVPRRRRDRRRRLGPMCSCPCGRHRRRGRASWRPGPRCRGPSPGRASTPLERAGRLQIQTRRDSTVGAGRRAPAGRRQCQRD